MFLLGVFATHCKHALIWMWNACYLVDNMYFIMLYQSLLCEVEPPFL